MIAIILLVVALFVFAPLALAFASIAIRLSPLLLLIWIIYNIPLWLGVIIIVAAAALTTYLVRRHLRKEKAEAAAARKRAEELKKNPPIEYVRGFDGEY